MTDIRCTTFIELDDNDLLELDDARGTTLSVTRGRLWVTQYGDPRDIVLGPGDTWTVERDGQTIVSANGSSALHAVGRSGKAARIRGQRAPLADRVLQWLGSWGLARFDRTWAPYV